MMTNETYMRDITADKIPNNPDASLQKMNAPGYMRVFSMEDIYGMIFTGKPWIIDGLLPLGLCILAGGSKLGKSFMAAQIAYYVSMGRPLWGRPVQQCPVLYLALEDNHRRLQSRMFRMFGVESTSDLYFSIEAKMLREGLMEQMTAFLREHPRTRLVIIDTLKKVRNTDDNSNCYAHDYDDMGLLKQFADANHICLLIIHHTRKQQDLTDPFNNISGTTGLMGAADTTFILSRSCRTDSEVILQLTGRDVADQKLYLSRDKEHLTWELDRVEVDEFSLPPDPVLDTVSQVVNAGTPQWFGSPSELAAQLTEEISPIALSKHLNINAARLLKEYSIQYQRKATHEGRRISLTFLPPKE